MQTQSDWQALESVPPLVERTRQALLDGICAGRLAPGQRLRQEELAELLGVSRQPISHALVLLKQQGFLRESGRRGLEVAPIAPEFLKDLFEVRAALDALAAGAAAARAHGHATWLARLNELVTSGMQAAKAADLPQLLALDVAFHELVAEMSGNVVVQDVTRQHWAHIRRGIAVALEDPAFHTRCWHEHAQIARAIGAGDVEAASRLARDHCTLAGAETYQRLKESTRIAA